MWGIEMRWIKICGIEMRGMETRGIEMRGMETRGIEMRGMETRGIEMRGMETRGIEMRWIKMCGIETREFQPIAGVVMLCPDPSNLKQIIPHWENSNLSGRFTTQEVNLNEITY